jgi:hypothetical protein
LAAFHKLVGLSSKQHTFIETETVRYLYQSLEDLYVVIITNKSSNIVEDLETLHIITKLVRLCLLSPFLISFEDVID